MFFRLICSFSLSNQGVLLRTQNNYKFIFDYFLFLVPICLPPDNADFTGRKATITGWGRLKYNGGVPSVLQEVQVMFETSWFILRKLK